MKKTATGDDDEKTENEEQHFMEMKSTKMTKMKTTMTTTMTTTKTTTMTTTKTTTKTMHDHIPISDALEDDADGPWAL